MEQNKRIKIMLAFGLVVILLMLLMGGKKSAAGAKSNGLLAKVSGVNLAAKEQEFRTAKSERDIAMQYKEKLTDLQQKVGGQKSDFWSFTKLGSPRGEIQQRIISLAKNVGLDDVRVSTGFERSLSNSNYLRVIDFAVSSRSFNMKKMADFMQAIDAEVNKIFWDDCKIFKVGNVMTFSANLRVYVFNKKAVDIIGKN